MYVGEAIDLWLVRASDSRLSAELRIGGNDYRLYYPVVS